MFKPYGERSASDYCRAAKWSDRLDAWPSAYLAVQRLRLRNAQHRIISRDHALAIEGFPRSGSSFAHRAFSSANPDLRRMVATHLHRSAQIVRASALGIPTMVLVRSPGEAVTSLLALTIQQGLLTNLNGTDAEKCVQATLERYATFHERILGLPGIMLVGFEEVITDFGVVITRANKMFDTKFRLFEHTDESAQAVMEKAKRHLSPNTDRDVAKASLAAAYDATANTQMRARATTSYDAIMQIRDRQLAEAL